MGNRQANAITGNKAITCNNAIHRVNATKRG